jgi:hypothetical protein
LAGIVDAAYNNRFEDLTFVTKAAIKKTSLNHLQYNMPAGFSKFVFSVENPPGDLQPNDVLAPENILGTKLRKIRAHY